MLICNYLLELKLYKILIYLLTKHFFLLPTYQKRKRYDLVDEMGFKKTTFM